MPMPAATMLRTASTEEVLTRSSGLEPGCAPNIAGGLHRLIDGQHHIGLLRHIGERDILRVEQRMLDRQPQPPPRADQRSRTAMRVVSARLDTSMTAMSSVPSMSALLDRLARQFAQFDADARIIALEAGIVARQEIAGDRIGDADPDMAGDAAVSSVRGALIASFTAAMMMRACCRKRVPRR